MIDIQYKKKSGIYKITSLVNKSFYIGSATCLYSRYHRHIFDLKKGSHANNHLQNLYNKYGRNNLLFEVIVLCIPKKLINTEQNYMDNLKPNINICKITNSTLGYKHTPETRIKLSEIRKGKQYSLGRKLSDESKRKMSLKAKERGLHPSLKEASIKANTGKKHSQERIDKRVIKQLKLSKKDILEIRKLLKQGVYQKDIAKKYNVSQRNICRINLGIGYYSNF